MQELLGEALWFGLYRRPDWLGRKFPSGLEMSKGKSPFLLASVPKALVSSCAQAGGRSARPDCVNPFPSLGRGGALSLLGGASTHAAMPSECASALPAWQCLGVLVVFWCSERTMLIKGGWRHPGGLTLSWPWLWTRLPGGAVGAPALGMFETRATTPVPT